MAKQIKNWTHPAPQSLPRTTIRDEQGHEGVSYRVATYGGDENGANGPDDDAILVACSRLVGAPLQWRSGSEWDVTNEAVDGEVTRVCTVRSKKCAPSR